MAKEKQPKHVAVGQVYKLGNSGRVILVTRANEQRQAVTLFDDLGKPSKVKRQIAFKTLWQVWTKVAETPEEYTHKTGQSLPAQAAGEASSNATKKPALERKAAAKAVKATKATKVPRAEKRPVAPPKERAKRLPINEDLVRKIVGEVFDQMSHALRSDMADFAASLGAGPGVTAGKVRVLGIVLDPTTFQALQEISKQWHKPAADVVAGLVRGLISSSSAAA